MVLKCSRNRCFYWPRGSPAPQTRAGETPGGGCACGSHRCLRGSGNAGCGAEWGSCRGPPREGGPRQQEPRDAPECMGRGKGALAVAAFLKEIGGPRSDVSESCFEWLGREEGCVPGKWTRCLLLCELPQWRRQEVPLDRERLPQHGDDAWCVADVQCCFRFCARTF